MSKRELAIFIGMSRALNEINRETGRLHKKYGLTTAQFGVLEALYHKGDMTIGQVRDKTLSTSGTIPVIVRNLEKEGLIERSQDPADKRKYILRIKDKGIGLMEEIYPENERIIVSMMDLWSGEEKEILEKLLKKFGGVLDEEKDRE